MSEIQVVVGIDIAKDSVEVSTLGAPGPEGGYGNDPEGHSALIAQVPAGALVVMEATGGYEAALACALQAAPTHAAEVQGVVDQGGVEAGKRADIIAMPGDPLADIGNVLKVDFVMKDGVVYKAPAR